MAPLPPENTRRFWLQYHDGVNSHELMVRGDTDTTPADIIVVLDEFLTELDPVLYEITIEGARYADASETVSNPVTWDGAATYGSGFQPVVNGPREIAFEFRSTDGRKGSVSVYGYNGSTPADYRFGSGEVAALDDARDTLSGAHADGTLCTISGLRGIFKTYINVNYNSYWERRARG